jgi:hypothetical protein
LSSPTQPTFLCSTNWNWNWKAAILIQLRWSSQNRR